MRRVGVRAAALASVLAACSSFGTVDPPPDPPPTDVEAGVEAGDDARGMTDGEVDAGSRFCERQELQDLIFCDDFDDGDGLAPWMQADMDPQTRYELSSSTFFSPPFAASPAIAPGNGGSQDARLRYAFPPVPRVELSVKVRMNRMDNENVPILAISFGAGGDIQVRANGDINEGVPQPDGGPMNRLLKDNIARFDSNRWYRVLVRVDLPNRQARVEIDEAQKVVELLPAKETAAAVGVSIGPGEVNATAGWTTYFDDVVVRKK